MNFKMPADARGQAFQAARLGAPQSITFGAASVASAPFAQGTQMIRVVATSGCRIKIGTSPVAGSTDAMLIGGVVEYFTVVGGEQIAVIQVSTAGTLSIAEIS